MSTAPTCGRMAKKRSTSKMRARPRQRRARQVRAIVPAGSGGHDSQSLRGGVATATQAGDFRVFQAGPEPAFCLPCHRCGDPITRLSDAVLVIPTERVALHASVQCPKRSLGDAIALLREIEWVPYDTSIDQCPICYEKIAIGDPGEHAGDCRLALLLGVNRMLPRRKPD